MCEIKGTFNASSRASGLNVMFLIYVSVILKGLGHETVFVAFRAALKNLAHFLWLNPCFLLVLALESFMGKPLDNFLEYTQKLKKIFLKPFISAVNEQGSSL